MTHEQNVAAAQHLHRSLVTRYPKAKQLNLLCLCSGSGRSEIYFVDYLRRKGIRVNELMAIDSEYAREMPVFLDRLEKEKLIDRGTPFVNEQECFDWKEQSSVLFDAVVAVHVQFNRFFSKDSHEAFDRDREHNLKNEMALSALLGQVDARGKSIPYVAFMGHAGGEAIEVTERTAAEHQQGFIEPQLDDSLRFGHHLWWHAEHS